jgi:hypothetical protein
MLTSKASNVLWGGWSVFDRLQRRVFSLLHSSLTSSDAHSESYPMGTGGNFNRGKRQVHEADHSHPFSAEVKNGGAISACPQIVMPQCLITEAPEQLYPYPFTYKQGLFCF